MQTIGFGVNEESVSTPVIGSLQELVAVGMVKPVLAMLAQTTVESLVTPVLLIVTSP